MSVVAMLRQDMSSPCVGVDPMIVCCRKREDTGTVKENTETRGQRTGNELWTD